MDLQQQLERDLGHGPPLPAPEQRLAAGRAALRRRRAAVGAGAVGVVAAVLAPLALVVGGTTPGVEPEPFAPVNSGPTTSPIMLREARSGFRWEEDQVATIVVRKDTFVPVIRPGAVVVEQRENLFPGKDTSTVAIVARFEGELYWALVEWHEGGATSDYASADDGTYESFDDFVAEYVRLGGLTSGPPVGGEPS